MNELFALKKGCVNQRQRLVEFQSNHQMLTLVYTAFFQCYVLRKLGLFFDRFHIWMKEWKNE